MMCRFAFDGIVVEGVHGSAKNYTRHTRRLAIIRELSPELVAVLLRLADTGCGVVLLKVVGVELNWGLGERLFLPLVWAQVATGLGNRLEGGLGEVAKRGSAALGTGVHIVVAGEREDLLGHWRRNDTGTAWGRDQSHVDGATLGVHLARHGMRFTELGSPVSATDRDNGELGEHDGRADRVCDFLRALDTESDVTVAVTDHNSGLESGSLTGTGLLLDRLHLQNLVLESSSEKVLDNFGFLDRQREAVDLAEGENLTIFNQTSKFRDRHPYFLVVAPASTAASTTTTATASSAAPAGAKAASMVCWFLISHCCLGEFFLL